MTTNAMNPLDFSELMDRLGPAGQSAIDVDEVAALLEANGINDRVAAGRYGVSTVFLLAAAIVSRIGRLEDQPPSRPGRRPLWPALLRSALYLTPTAVAAAVAGRLAGVPNIATVGTLLLGWSLGQVLAYFGHATRHAAGSGPAARLVAAGFAGLTVGWEAILYLLGLPQPLGYLVAGVQLAMFASVAAALVTGRETRLALCAVPVWLAAGALYLGARGPAVIALLAGLDAMVIVAYWPALGRRVRWAWPPLATVRPALGHGAVGGGQAVLFVIITHGLAARGGLSTATVPLLLGVPLVEMAVAWHQHRVELRLSTVYTRGRFGRSLNRVGYGTLAVLSLPVTLGAVIAGLAWLHGLPLGWLPVASGVLLASLYAISLCCAAQRQIAVALLVLWCPAVPLAFGSVLLGSMALPAPPQDLVIPAVLLATSLPALIAAGVALTDPRGYR